MDKNQGYEIMQAVLFDNGRGFALGHNPAAPNPFVTWQFTQEDGKRDYYWGRYHNEEDQALGDYNRRVLEYERQYGVQAVEKYGPDYFKYYSTQRPVAMGTYPHSKENLPVAVLNYGERIQVEGEPFRAWGEVWFMRPLTKEQIINYELHPAHDNPEPRGQERKPKRDSPDHGSR